MPIESYSLVFKLHKGEGCAFSLDEDDEEIFWMPKSQIEVDGVSHEEDFDNLVRGEVVDVYIPDWLAEQEGLL